MNMSVSTTAYYPRERLNILMVSVPPDTKGPLPLLTQLLVSGLQQLGHKVTLAACWGHKEEGESLPKKITQRAAGIRRILREAKKYKYELIYIHSSLDPRALLRDLPLVAVLKLQKAPVVIIFHGSDLQALEGRRNLPFYLGTRLLFKLLSGVLVDSTEEQKSLMRLWPWAKVGVVPQPMAANPVEGIISSSATAQKSIPTLLFTGRLIAEKGVKEVLEAFFIAHSSLDCKLVIAGDGPLKDLLLEMAAARPDLRESIEFTGYLDRQGMWQVYRRTDVLVLPTYHPEGMPTVILEAMASGLGIICTPIRGAADYLKEGRNVFFVPPQRPDLLANRIVELLNSPERLNQMKQANFTLSRSFEPKSAASRQIEVIRSFFPEPLALEKME